MAPWSFVYLSAGAILALVWLFAEAVSRRQRLVDWVERVVAR
jgi:hypothetical protein